MPAIEELSVAVEFLVPPEELHDWPATVAPPDVVASESTDSVPADIRLFVANLCEEEGARMWRLDYARRCLDLGLGLKKSKSVDGHGRDLWVHTMPDKGQRALSGLRPSSGRLEVRIEYSKVEHQFDLAEPVSNSPWTRIYLVSSGHVAQAVRLTQLAAGL